jgi:mono/diheme cytochrome c family protein
MPAFTPSRVPENEARELWAYLSAVMGDVKRNDDEAQLSVQKITVRTDPRNIQKGEKLFKENCSSCHAAASTETIIGPGLKGILRRQSLPVSGRPASAANIYRQLKTPYKEMPSFSAKLTDDQMLDIIAYLNTLPL